MVVKKSKCLFCSLGCGLAFRTKGDQVLAIEYDGPICPRGYYNFELLNHPERLTAPKIGKRIVSWDEAISYTKQEMKLFEKESVGILVSSNASNEDVVAAAALARAIGTTNIAASGTLSDIEAYKGNNLKVEGAALATLEEVEQAEVLVIVGDLLTRSPVLAKRVNKVKFGKRGNKIIVIDPHKSHTSWFATDHLAARAGSEALVLAALTGKMSDTNIAAERAGVPVEKIKAAAQAFHSAASGVVLIVPSDNRERNDLTVYFAKELAAASPNKKYLVYYGYGNTLGVNTVIDREVPEHLSFSAILKKLESQELKALFMFGENICSEQNDLGKKLRMLKFVAVSGYFGRESSITSDTVVTYPLASQLEVGGTYTLADGATQRIEPVVPPVGSKSNKEVIDLLGIPLSEPATGNRKQAAVKFDEQLAAAITIEPKDQAPSEEITHFGNNRLVGNFFWYRVSNG